MEKLLFLFLCCRFAHGQSVIVDNVPDILKQINASHINNHLLSREPEVSGSDQKSLSEKPIKKILQPPLAFSYNEAKEDSVSESTDEKADTSKKYEKGGGKKSYIDHYSDSGEKGEKKYESSDAHVKKETGHYDKEGHEGNYKDEGKKETKYFAKDGYEAEHGKGNAQEKHSKFEEEGTHDKGHSTKGSHSLNKKDHYEKKTEFYDDFFDEDDVEKFFDFSEEKDFKKGSDKKGSHKISADGSSEYGKKKSDEHKKHYKNEKIYKKGTGHDKHHEHEEKFGKKHDNRHGKEWGFGKGDGKKNKKESQATENKDTIPSHSRKYFTHYHKPENYNNERNDDKVDISKIKEQYKHSTNALDALESLVQSLENNNFTLINGKKAIKNLHSDDEQKSNVDVAINDQNVPRKVLKPPARQITRTNRNVIPLKKNREIIRNVNEFKNFNSSNTFIANVTSVPETGQLKEESKRTAVRTCKCIITECDQV